MIDLILNNLTSWFIGLFLSALTYLINKLVKSITKTQKMKREQIEKESSEQSDMKIALLYILRSHINDLTSEIRKRGYITSDEDYDLEEMSSVYFKLGGNGRTEKLIERVKNQYPVYDDIEMYEIGEK